MSGEKANAEPEEESILGEWGGVSELRDHIIYCPNQDSLRVKEGTVSSYAGMMGTH